MAILGLLYFWNARLVIFPGILFNLMLIWLIVRKTPKEMRMHSWILLQTCFVDILLLFVDAVGLPVVVELNDYYIAFFDGFLFAQFWNVFGVRGFPYIYAMGNVILYLNIFGIGAQFIYRYLMLNWNAKITLGRYMLMLAVPLVCILTYFTIKLFKEYIGEVEKQRKVDATFLNNFFNPGEEPCYFTFDDTGTFVWVNCMEVAFYVLIGFCAIQMVRYVRAHIGMTEHLRLLNKQLTRNLFILAILPLFLSGLDIILLVWSLVDKFAHDGLTVQWLINLPYFWLPVLNPLVSIATNKPYRNAVKNIVYLEWRTKSQQIYPAIP